MAAAFYVYALMNPREDERVSMSKVLGISLVFVGVLALLELYEVDLGGMTGLALTYPLTFMVGTMVTGVLLFGFILIGSFLIFNTGLRLPKLGRKKSEDSLETDDLGLDELDLPELKEKSSKEKEEKPEEAPEEEVEPKKGLGAVAGKITDTLGIEKNVGDIVVKHFSGPYIPPSLTLLNKDKGKAMAGDVKANSLTIKRTLKEFGINVEMDAVESGPAITRYSLKPAQGVRISRIVALQQELQLALKASTIRIEAPIPGSHSLVSKCQMLSARPLDWLLFSNILSTPTLHDHSSLLLVRMWLVASTLPTSPACRMPSLPVLLAQVSQSLFIILLSLSSSVTHPTSSASSWLTRSE